MRKTILETKSGNDLTHVQERTFTAAGTVVGSPDLAGRHVIPGSLKHMSNIKSNRYDYRPAGKR